MTSLTDRTWAEVHLDRLAHNYRAIRGCIPAETKYLALVKANAYGHGAVPLAKKFVELGADILAVACLSEAEELRTAGIDAPILILGYTNPASAPELLDLNLTQTVYDEGMARAFSDAALVRGKHLRIHLKADTGMSRLGFLCDEANLDASAAAMLRIAALPGLEIEGLFMHFSVADSPAEENMDYSRRQLARYRALCDRLAAGGLTVPIRHCAASAALIRYPEAHFNMVRPGIIQFGLDPDGWMHGMLDLQPVMELKTRIASVKNMPAGTSISYGRTHTLKRDSRVAVVPVGYGDGLFRLLSNRQDMLVRGTRVPQIGRVCMDMCMLDVTDVPDVSIGDTVTVFGDGLPLQEKADTLGTITYELVCDIAPRVPRIYLE